MAPLTWAQIHSTEFRYSVVVFRHRLSGRSPTLARPPVTALLTLVPPRPGSLRYCMSCLSATVTLNGPLREGGVGAPFTSPRRGCSWELAGRRAPCLKGPETGFCSGRPASLFSRCDICSYPCNSRLSLSLFSLIVTGAAWALLADKPPPPHDSVFTVGGSSRFSRSLLLPGLPRSHLRPRRSPASAPSRFHGFLYPPLPHSGGVSQS